MRMIVRQAGTGEHSSGQLSRKVGICDELNGREPAVREVRNGGRSLGP